MITIIDYQMGNLRSVQKGFERVGHEASITSNPEVITNATKLVLPGVGAFGDAMDELTRREFIEPIRQHVAADKPFLGICLGLQLLFETSTEGGHHDGLGILPGKVVRFEVPSEFKVPHMGWNQAHVRRPAPALEGIPDQTDFYFVHSYYVVPADEDVIVTETDYHQMFCSTVCRGQLFACQFHPEKSQSRGLAILKNFGRHS